MENPKPEPSLKSPSYPLVLSNIYIVDGVAARYSGSCGCFLTFLDADGITKEIGYLECTGRIFEGSLDAIV